MGWNKGKDSVGFASWLNDLHKDMDETKLRTKSFELFVEYCGLEEIRKGVYRNNMGLEETIEQIKQSDTFLGFKHGLFSFSLNSTNQDYIQSYQIGQQTRLEYLGK